jgi:hypothetical protein
MPTRGIDLVLASLDAALDRSKITLALVDVVLAASAAFAVVLVGNLAGDRAVALALAVVWAGVVWIVHAVVAGAIARIAHVELSLGPPIDLPVAVTYALRHGRSLVVAPGVVVLVTAGVIGVEAAALLVSRLPAVGDVAAAVLFLPAVLVNMALILLAVPALWLTPAVVAADGGATRATLGQVWATIRAAPGRLLLYLVATVIVMAVVGIALAAVMWLAISMALSVAGWAGLEAARADGFLAMLADLGLSGLDAGHVPATTALVPLIVYVLYGVLLVALVATIPLLVFPVCAACAARISVTGETGASATDDVGPV